MPIIRYVLFAASFVVALLSALDRFLPPSSERFAAPDVDRSIIRIHSDRALPEKIVFDTSARVLTAASSPLLAHDPPNHPARDAMAMAEAAKPEANVAPRLQRGATRDTRSHANRAPRLAPQ